MPTAKANSTRTRVFVSLFFAHNKSFGGICLSSPVSQANPPNSKQHLSLTHLFALLSASIDLDRNSSNNRNNIGVTKTQTTDHHAKKSRNIPKGKAQKGYEGCWIWQSLAAVRITNLESINNNMMMCVLSSALGYSPARMHFSTSQSHTVHTEQYSLRQS